MKIVVRILQDIWTRELGGYEACMSLLVESSENILINAGRSGALLALRLVGGIVRIGVLTNWSREHYAGFKILAGINEGFTLYVPPGPTRKLEKLGFEVVTVEDEVKVGDAFITPLKGKSHRENETYVVVESRQGPLVIAGCGLHGAERLVEKAIVAAGSRPFIIIGGLIVRGWRDADAVKRFVDALVCMPNRLRDSIDDSLLGEVRDKLCWVSPGSIILLE